MRIGLDVDGVLANFENSYESLLASIAGKEPRTFPADGPPIWDYDKDYYSAETIHAAWHIIKTDRVFWGALRPMPNMHLLSASYIDPKHDLYFITNRPGINAKHQTECWLNDRLDRNVTVLITEHKGLVAKALNLDIYIDDKPSNVTDTMTASPGTTVYIQDRAYNREHPYGIRILDISPILKLITQ